MTTIGSSRCDKTAVCWSDSPNNTLYTSFKMMQQTALVFSAIVAVVFSQQGPSTPVNGFTARDCQAENQFFADGQSLCWYHRCLNSEFDNGFVLMPEACAGGSIVSEYFVTGVYNPCTVNLHTDFGYECRRTSVPVDTAPPCVLADAGRCQNGGTLTYEAQQCWCLCPFAWQGNWDCSLPTGDPNAVTIGGNICVNGTPERDWCLMAGGCLNGGTCFNQCDSFWCDCPNRQNQDQYGKRCEHKP